MPEKQLDESIGWISTSDCKPATRYDSGCFASSDRDSRMAGRICRYRWLTSGRGCGRSRGSRNGKGPVGKADLVLWIHDLTDPWEAGRIEQIPHQQMLVIGNKADLTTEVPDWAQLVVSAQTSAGIDSLLELILETLVPGFGNPDFKVLFLKRWKRKCERFPFNHLDN